MTDPLDFMGLLVPPGFTRYCGSCGAVWGGCGCAELAARKQVVEAVQAVNKYDDDPVWDALFEKSQDMLVAMANEALADHLAGKTVPMDVFLAQPDAPPAVTRYGVEICPVCDFPKQYCKGHEEEQHHVSSSQVQSERDRRARLRDPAAENS